MDLMSINLKDTYRSGEDNLLSEFYIPCIKNSNSYDRAVGYFNSSILKHISKGLYYFIKNNGKMRLICSVELSEEDKKRIEDGYASKDILEKNLEKTVNELILNENSPELKNIAWLIKKNHLDIKICLGFDSLGTLYHEKFGIFKDKNGNMVTFMGSINETQSGWIHNVESFEVSYSWEPALYVRISDKIRYFEDLWNGNAKNIKTYDFPEAVREEIIKIAPIEPIPDTDENYEKNSKIKFSPRKCQKEAYETYLKNNSCLFQMATGSGKTKAALYSFMNSPSWRFLLILVPLKDLIYQWETEIKLFFPNEYIIKCYSGSNWKKELLCVIDAKIPSKTIVISTYASACGEYAFDKWERVDPNIFGMIFDEVHNLGAPKTQKLMYLDPKFKIGLSATPDRNYDEEGSDKIFEYFGDNNYIFSIKDAINEGYLVEYEYSVCPYELTLFEWETYVTLTEDIKKLYGILSGCNVKNRTKYENKLKKKLIARSELLKTSKNKKDKFIELMKTMPEKNRVLVYCDSKEHITEYSQILDELDKDYYIYVGDKKEKERKMILKNFELGIKKILLAIRCLDEGIDIPVCDSAIFVSSSNSEREFIQRRGRVLRKSSGKNRAYVYDFLSIPPYNKYNDLEIKAAKEVIEKEYRRINIIADDAINGIKTKNKIDNKLDEYNLNPFRC